MEEETLETLRALNYIAENNLAGEVNKLYAKTGNVYVAIAIVYYNIEQTPETIEICRRISCEAAKAEKAHYESMCDKRLN